MVTKRFSGAFSQCNFSQKHPQLLVLHRSKHTNKLLHPIFEKEDFTASWNRFKVLFTNYCLRDAREEMFREMHYTVGCSCKLHGSCTASLPLLSGWALPWALLRERLNPIKLLPFLPFIPSPRKFVLQQARDQGMQITSGDISGFALEIRAVPMKTWSPSYILTPSFAVSSVLSFRSCKFPSTNDTGAEWGYLLWPHLLEKKKGGRNIEGKPNKYDAS